MKSLPSAHRIAILALLCITVLNIVFNILIGREAIGIRIFQSVVGTAVWEFLTYKIWRRLASGGRASAYSFSLCWDFRSSSSSPLIHQIRPTLWWLRGTRLPSRHGRPLCWSRRYPASDSVLSMEMQTALNLAPEMAEPRSCAGSIPPAAGRILRERGRYLILWMLPCLALASCKPKGGTVQQVDPSTIRQGPILHELSPAQVARITKLQETFREVDHTPLAEWLEDFSRDENPDREIGIWEGMAGPYVNYVEKHQPSGAARKEIFSVLLQRSGSPEEAVLQRHKRITLTEAEMKELLGLYTAPPQPIRVSKE